MKSYGIDDLICLSLMVSDSEQTHMCILAIWIPQYVKDLFKYVSHFLLGCTYTYRYTHIPNFILVFCAMPIHFLKVTFSGEVLNSKLVQLSPFSFIIHALCILTALLCQG